LAPHGIRRFADAVFLHQLSGHRRQHVVVFLDVVQPFSRELAFQRQCHEKLLAHQAQALGLHGFFPGTGRTRVPGGSGRCATIRRLDWRSVWSEYPVS
jgi:hypothetical protein